MRTLALLFGLLVLALLVAMAVAGFPGAVGILATVVGIMVMIVLGVQLGGRHSSPGRAAGAAASSSLAPPGGPAAPGGPGAPGPEAGPGGPAAPGPEPGPGGPAATGTAVDR